MSSAIHFRKSLLRLLQSSDYKPVKKEALSNILKISKQKQELFFECIDQLMLENQIEYGKNHKIQIRESDGYIKGRIKFKQNGSALFFPEGANTDEPYTIAEQDTNVALQGDTILGRIIEKKKPRFDYRKKRKKSQAIQAIEAPCFRVLKIYKEREIATSELTEITPTNMAILLPMILILFLSLLSLKLLSGTID